MPKSSHDTVLNEIPVAQRHTLVPSLNDISDKTRKLQQHYHHHHHHPQQQCSKDHSSKAKKASLNALNQLDKEPESARDKSNKLVNYGETVLSHKKMYATSTTTTTQSGNHTYKTKNETKLTSKSNHFDLNAPKEAKSSREKLFNVISLQPSSSSSKQHRSGFDELDILLNKTKNLQSFQTNLLNSSHKHKQTNSSNNNISSSSSGSSKSKSTKTSCSSGCAKSAATGSRVSLNQADVISSNLARAKETIKKMSSSTNLDQLVTSNNTTNEIPVLVPLPMPFSAPSYSSFYNFGSNPNISVPQTPTPQPVQQQTYTNNSDPLQPLTNPSMQLPSNIPLVIPLGPPETTSLYNLNQPYYHQIPQMSQPPPVPQQQQQQQHEQSKPPQSNYNSNHKQKIKELKLKKQSKQSKSMEASINKIPQEEDDFEVSKSKLFDLKNINNNKIDSFTPQTTNYYDHVNFTPCLEPIQPQMKTRLPPPPLPPNQITSISNNQQIISKKSDDDLTAKAKQEISARLKQPSLHITEPIKADLQPKEPAILITDSNYTMPQTNLYPKLDLSSPNKSTEAVKSTLKPATSQDNIYSTKPKEIKETPQQQPPTQAPPKQTSSTSKKLNDLTELLQNSTTKYGIYKNVPAQPVNQLQSKSAIQPPQQAVKQKQMETKAVSTNDISDLKQQPFKTPPPPPPPKGPIEYKTSLHIGKQFNSNEITVHLVDDLLEDKKTPIKKLLIHCNRVEPISSRSVTLTPGGQFNQPVDMNLNDSKNYMRKELKREIVLPTDCDIDSLESYLENGNLYFKCFLLKPPQLSELKHAQIVSLPRIDFKSASLDPTTDQSTIIKRSLLNATNLDKKNKHDHINKSILKLNSDDLADSIQTESTSETTTTTTTNSTLDQLTTSSSKTTKTSRGRHQSLPSGSSTKSVRFNMNNRTFQLEDTANLNSTCEIKNDLTTGQQQQQHKLARHTSNTTSAQQQYRQRHRSSSSKSKQDQLQAQQQASSSSHRRNNTATANLSNRLSNDLIQDGFNCITKDGLENIFLTYFFKLPSCSPSDRTQVRIEKNSILKLKIIQEKNFAKKASKKRHHSHRRHHHTTHHHHHRHHHHHNRHHSNSSRRHARDSSSSSLSSSFISSALSSSSSDSSLSSSSSDLDSSDESTVNNEKITKIKQDDETTKIVLREFSRRCRLPYKVFKFDETGVTVSFINNDWVRVEIPILEILDTNLMATMTSETNLSLLNNNNNNSNNNTSKKVKSSYSKLDSQEVTTSNNNDEKIINKLKMGGSAYKC